MNMKFRLLYPQGYDVKQESPMKDYKFIQSLQIEDMIVLVRDSYRGIRDLALENFFTTDERVLAYRLDIVEDLLAHPTVYDVFCKAIPLIYNISDLRHVLNRDFNVDSALGSVRYLEMYQEVIQLFADAFSGQQFCAEGMKAFQNYIEEIVNSSEFQSLHTELSKMEMDFGQLKSVTIGLNLDENLQPKEAGILSVNQTAFQPGTIMDRLLRKEKMEKNRLMTTLYPLAKGLHGEELRALNLSLNTALYSIFSKSLSSFEPLVQNFYSENTTFFITLLDDLRFLTAGVGFIRSMKEKGFCMCKPVIAPMQEKKCELEKVYNPVLAQKLIEDTVVSNSVTFDENGRFYLVTGPNHGGKSIFAYSVGMTQALFQLGLFVPAEHAVLSPVTGIFTHFPSSDKNNYGKGRLESECARLSEITKVLSDTDMLLMDESFASTSGLEASYIASEVLTAIGVIGCRGIFVTHIHDLPSKVAQFNAYPGNRGKIDNLVALMENKENGTRSYRISRTTPDGLSYAKDIARQYGLDLAGILADAYAGELN